MKILLTGSSPGTGLHFVPANLAISLKKCGIDVQILSGDEEIQQTHYLKNKLRQHNIKLFESKLIDKVAPLSLFQSVIELKDILQKENVSLIHVLGTIHATKAIMAIKMLKRKIPILQSMHHFEHQSKFRSEIYGSLMPFFINHFIDIVAPCSEQIGNILVNHGLDIKKNKPIQNGLDLAEFDREKQNNIPSSINDVFTKHITDILLIYPAVLTPRKGHKYLLLAMKKIINTHPNTYLMIVGDGAERTHLGACPSNMHRSFKRVIKQAAS
jgi:glycosyltransferase involved in cell wall biosynthesis